MFPISKGYSMENKKHVSRRRVLLSIIVLFCTVVALSVIGVLVFVYRPDRNSLGALGSVCLDVISMLVITILVINLSFGKDRLNRTSKLFVALMLVTILALFLDFMTWSLDGTLSFDDGTFLFILGSLGMGAVLACLLLSYLSSYLEDMYGIKGAFKRVRVCVLLNVIAYIFTITLGLTHYAFDIVDGHYVLGSLYDLITVIPVLTILYMTGYVIRRREIIGRHDVLAIILYMFTMLVGVAIEAIYGVGATYVSIAIADIFIFIMLQNRLLDRFKKQGALLEEKVTDQYEILTSMAGIYAYVNYVNLEDNTSSRFNIKGDAGGIIDMSNESHTELNRILYDGIVDEHKDDFWAYTDLATLPKRLEGEKLISAEFCHKEDGWLRAHYIRIGDDVHAPVKRVIYTIRNIDEEKKKVEMWIKKSNTDELTGLYNRHAYEDEITLLEQGELKENFVYISVDVNGLKVTNDSFGHDAGDELIVGAADIMRQCFGSYGKLFRTGGDEFVALIYADESQLAEIKKDIAEVTENWHGKKVSQLTMACGYMPRKEAMDMTLHQMAVNADKKMYEDKTRYYQRKGYDRRGQRDAHVALYELYTKILKINVTDDTYQIINMSSDEQTPAMGYAPSISQWMSDFGTSGQVHPDDLEEYLAHTNLDYIRNYFTENKTSLKIYYRRKSGDGFEKVMMEMIPANDYKAESQSLFLYVKSI